MIKPTMTYGAECWAVRKQDENRLHVAEIRMLRWIRGKARKGPCQKPDHTRGCKSVPNVNIPETETMKFVRTYQEKRRRQLIKKNHGHGRTGEGENGGGLGGDGLTTTKKI